MSSVAELQLLWIFRRVTNFTAILLTKDGRFVSIVFEFEQVMGRVFKEKRAVLNAGPRESHTRLLIEGQGFRLGSICQRLPVFL